MDIRLNFAMKGDRMKNVLIVGGGLAGCVVARELSEAGIHSVLLESLPEIGGKVREYGCKADTRCNQCGVCLTGNLFDQVENDDHIDKRIETQLLDLYPDHSGYTAYIQSGASFDRISVSDVVFASGFSDYTEHATSSLERTLSNRIITGNDIEKLLKNRTTDALFEQIPRSVAFILCYGSRDKKEDAQYCSRVCCSYSTRTAKVIKHYYPQCEVVMFYMDLQSVNSSPRYIDDLKDAGITFERCKPSRIVAKDGIPSVQYEGSNGFTVKSFDYIILCEGIHPSEENASLSNIGGLRVDENGFLQYVRSPEITHIYLAGTVSGPKNIRETAADARNTAARIIEMTM